VKIPSIPSTMLLSAVALVLALYASPYASAQGGPLCTGVQMRELATKHASSTSGTTSAAATVQPHEEDQYQGFLKLKPEDVDERVRVGDAFVQKYPDGPFTESVYSQLTTAEYQKHDFAKMDEDADRALTLNPDDLAVLVLVGWVIPHSPKASAKELEKAESYERHVLEIVPTLTKPEKMTATEFAAAKSDYESQAHSGMGLVYYQRQNFAGAVTELTKATAQASRPDPTDYYVIGLSLGSMDRYSEAAAAYAKCGAIPGSEQSVCRQRARDGKKLAAAKPVSSANL